MERLVTRVGDVISCRDNCHYYVMLPKSCLRIQRQDLSVDSGGLSIGYAVPTPDMLLEAGTPEAVEATNLITLVIGLRYPQYVSYLS